MRKKKTIANILSTFMLQIITIICGFIVPRLILESFGSSANGLVSSITQFLSYISLIDGGFGVVIKAALYKPISKNDSKEINKILKTSEKIFKRIAYAFIFYIIILAFIFPLINDEFSFPYILTMILSLSIGTFVEYYFGITYKLFLTAKQQLYITSSLQIILYVVNTILVYILIKCGASLQIVKLVSSLIFIIRPMFQYWYVKKNYNLDLKNADVSQESISQRWSGMIQHIASVVHSNTDIAIITIFLNLSEVSVYAVYLSVMNGIKNLVISISTGIEATFGELIANEDLKKLNDNFKIYEFLQFNLITIVFATAMVLIIPFIKIYTGGITDTNYVRPIFAFVFIITQAIYCIKTIYNSLALTAGKIKETRNGALVEALTNIVLSIALVNFYGIEGIIIATFISVLIRCLELIIFVSKKILRRSIGNVIKNVVTSIISFISIYIIFSKLVIISPSNYFEWFACAIFVSILSTAITSIINLVSSWKECRYVMSKIKGLAVREKENCI